MSKITLPGTVVVAVIALIPELIQWLQGDWGADMLWAPGVVILLGAALKLVELYRPQPSIRAGAARVAAPVSRLRRWLLG